MDNLCLRSLEGLQEFETKAKEQLLNQNMLHLDETPIRVENNKNDSHIICNEAISLILHHFGRGMAAVVDIRVLDKIKGILFYDCYPIYFHKGKRNS